MGSQIEGYPLCIMAEKLALKRLAGSDLLFFDYHFRNKTYGDHRQKGINLNTDVFVDQFYPQAHVLIGARWPVLTTLYGPGIAPAFVPPGNPQRPITYNNAKNWRLNGGTIQDDAALPEAADEDHRYDVARLYDIDEDGAFVRIAENIRAFARTLLNGLQLPAGVRIDGFSIDPGALRWGEEIAIERPDEEDENEDHD